MYILTGTATYSNQSNRDAALARVNTAMSSHTYSSVDTQFPGGINTPNTTSITFSIAFDSDGPTVASAKASLMGALTQSNRHTSGYVSVNIV